MDFAKYDLGRLESGSTVVVTLKGSAANVRLMDSSDFTSYKNGRKHKYIGGLVKRSPIRLQVPKSGHWYVTVDMIGLKGSARSSVNVEPPPLPVARQSPMRAPLDGVANDTPPEVFDTSQAWDVFVSHASEDKSTVVMPLVDALTGRGLDVWVDERELKIGDSLRQRIDHGLARSSFGVVILSRSFLRKGWTNYELDGIVSKTVAGKQRMLPIWHEITKDEVLEYSPTLVDRIARSTALYTLDEIAAEIADVVRSGGE